MSDHAAKLRASLTLEPEETAILVCDMQDGLNGVYYKDMVQVLNPLLKAAKILGVQTIVTEYEVEKFGHTTPELLPLLKELNAPILVKPDFSMYPTIKHLLGKKVKTVLICGIAAHCCVYHTTIDMLDAGYNVHVLKNCVTSWNAMDRRAGLETLRDIGAVLTTVTTAIMAYVRTSKHPKNAELEPIYLGKLPEIPDE
ncbi:isochorismatase family protein [Aphelenchoides avenae]|nr:isochorismatase family protein [Aphelenchus avenae]